MSPQPIQYDGVHVDSSGRWFTSTTVAASPAASSETTVCTVTCTNDLASQLGVMLFWALAFTVGTSGTAVTYKVRRTDTSGATVYTSGATTGGVSAGNLIHVGGFAFDSGGYVNGRVYVVTMTVTGGAATSTVSAAHLGALVV